MQSARNNGINLPSYKNFPPQGETFLPIDTSGLHVFFKKSDHLKTRSETLELNYTLLCMIGYFWFAIYLSHSFRFLMTDFLTYAQIRLKLASLTRKKIPFLILTTS